jgi:hypothetical protein
MKFTVPKWEWVAGLSFTLGLAVFGVANRTIDRINGRWTFFEKPLESDGRYYLFQSQRYRGLSIEDATKSVEGVFGYGTFGIENQNPLAIPIVETRPIYPFLTSILGPASKFSLMAFPILAWFMINYLIYLYLVKTFAFFPVLIVQAIVSSSFYFRYNLIASTTDALALLLILPYLRVCFSEFRLSKFYYITFFTTVLSFFVRPMSPFIIMVSCMMLLYSKSRLDRIFHILTILSACIHLFYLQVFENQITIQANINSTSLNTGFLIEVIAKIPIIIGAEFAFLAANDTLLFVLVILGLVSSFKLGGRYRALTITVFIASFLVAAVNGTIGNGFRYQLPIIIIIIPMILLFIGKYVPKEFYSLSRSKSKNEMG